MMQKQRLPRHRFISRLPRHSYIVPTQFQELDDAYDKVLAQS